MTDNHPARRSLVTVALVASCVIACSGTSESVQAKVPSVVSAPVSYTFVGQAGELVSSETMRGRVTIGALVTTYDWASQLVLRRVDQALGSYVPRINAFAVILEPPSYAVLAPAFAHSLNLHFPVVMADQASLEGGGALGPIDYVPTLVVMDPEGRVVERLKGLVESEQIKAALDRASGRSAKRETP